MWGKISISDIQSKDESDFKIGDGSIIFSENKSQENRLVDTIKINLDKPKINLTIEIIEREFYEDPLFYQTELNN